MKDETIEKMRRLCDWALHFAQYEREVNFARDILTELDANLGRKMTPETEFAHREKSCDVDHEDWHGEGLCKDCTIRTLRAAMHFAATHGKPSDYELSEEKPT